MKNSEKIDIVITWVDFNDPVWRSEYNKYVSDKNKTNNQVAGKARYAAHDTFKYLFRGIEKYASWVNKVFFVTFGHVPSWLNTECEKIVIVKHTDFIPEQYLPTFNSNAILLNLHRIKGLSEHFILFNDDMYLTNFCKKNDFFRHGLPCDFGVENPIFSPNFDPFWDMMLNNLCVINRNFSKKQAHKTGFFKWFNLRYGMKNIVRNICNLPYKKFTGFYDCHLPNSHLKSVYEEIWEKEYDICNQTCLNKFRSNNDITEWTMKYWQLASNKFYPINKTKMGVYVSLTNNSYQKTVNSKYKKKLICLNDEKDDMTDIDCFFNERLSEKSSFER